MKKYRELAKTQPYGERTALEVQKLVCEAEVGAFKAARECQAESDEAVTAKLRAAENWIESLSKAMEDRRNTSDLDTWNFIARMLVSLGKKQEAVTVLRRICSDNPEYIIGWSNLGAALLLSGGDDEKIFKKVCSLTGKSPAHRFLTLTNHGIQLFQRNMYVFLSLFMCL